MKDEREILTREDIYKKLLREAKRSIVGSLLMLALVAVVSGIFLPLIASAAPYLFYAIFGSFFLILLFCLFCVWRGCLRIGKARRGEFSVIEDTLVNVEVNKLSFGRILLGGGRFRDYLNHVLCFQSGKKIVINSGEYQKTHLDSIVHVSFPGDTFILVFYPDTPEKIIWLYSTKVYNYKG